MHVETHGLVRDYHCPCRGTPARPSPPVHAAESRLCFSVSFHRIYLCDESSEREEKETPPCQCSADAKPEGVPFQPSFKRLSPFFPLASWFGLRSSPLGLGGCGLCVRSDDVRSLTVTLFFSVFIFACHCSSVLQPQ